MNTAFELRKSAIHIVALSFAMAVLLGRTALASDPSQPPAVGEIAPDFTLSAVDGAKTQLSRLRSEGPVVLIVLRGFPGYQCPVCNTQVGQFLASAKKFKVLNANVVLVYPGPADGLTQRAAEFIRGKTLPDNFHLVLDPDFAFTNSYHLRWDAKNETAYPSTFVISREGQIQFAKVSKTHGGRASVEEVLKAIPNK